LLWLGALGERWLCKTGAQKIPGKSGAPKLKKQFFVNKKIWRAGLPRDFLCASLTFVSGFGGSYHQRLKRSPITYIIHVDE